MLTQKPKMSSLNPYAEPYIPVQMQGSQSSNSLSKAQSNNKQEKVTPDHYVKGTEIQIAACLSDQNKIKYENKEYLMDLVYLTVLFPASLKQHLVDVYILNNGNLGATIEMLEKGYDGSKHLAHAMVHRNASSRH